MARTSVARRPIEYEEPRTLREIWADLQRCETEIRESMQSLAAELGSLLLPPEECSATTAPPIDVGPLVLAHAEATTAALDLQLSLFTAARVPAPAAPNTTEETPMPRAAAACTVTTTRAAKKLSREALLVLDAVTVHEGPMAWVAKIPLATAPALCDLAPAYRNGDRLERKLYEEVNAALSALGGKWVGRKVQGHVFDADPSEAIGAVVETGEFVDPKKLYQFFETPPELAARLVEMAAIEPGMKVLEPSAGKGAIAGAVVEVMPDHVHQLICVEVNPSMAERLRERFTVMEADFLGVTFRPERLFERVVMNPPFAGQADIDHVRHAFDLLKPGGRLVSVMSSGVLFRENAKTVAFREWCGLADQAGPQLNENGDRLSWDSSASGVAGRVEKLPAGTFAASGTGVNAVVLVLDKAA